MLILVPAFAISFAGSAALTPVVRKIARRFSIVAVPRHDRWHSEPTALLGGAAIWAGGMLGLLVLRFDTSLFRDSSGYRGIAGIVVAATFLFVVGLVDDFRRLTPPTKLLFQMMAAALVINSGIVYTATPSVTANVVFSIFWVIAITNSFNLLDNIDGLTSGVAGLAAVFLSVNFAILGATSFAVISMTIAGASLGFLPYNFSRASIFMGDSGSLFLGMMLASLCAAYPAHSARTVLPVLLVPVFTLVVPIVDTLLVTTLRKLAGQPVSAGGRDHTSHRLVAMGLSERQVALLFYGVSAAGGGLGLWLSRDRSQAAALLAAVFLATVAVGVRFLARLHKYDPQAAATANHVTLIVSDLLHKRRSAEMLIDIILFGVAFRAALLLTGSGAPAFAHGPGLLAAVVFTKVAAVSSAGIYRSVWNRGPADELRKLLLALAAASVGMVVTGWLLTRAPLALELTLLDLAFASALTIGARAMYLGLEHAHLVLQVPRRPLVPEAQQ